MEQAKISNLYDLEQTIAKDLFEGATYPWEVLGKISGFIRELGPKLDPERFEQRGEGNLGGKERERSADRFFKRTFDHR